VEKTMTQPTTRPPVASIIPDETIYPRKGIDHTRAGIFSETIRDGFDLDPVEMESRKLKPETIAILKDPGAAIDGGNP
jgi:hypothetical protein